MIKPISRTHRYRMPVVFGPTVGPRQGPSLQNFDYSDSPRTTIGASFLTDAESLARLVPPGCRLEGEPIVTVERTELRNLEWLAGRGYSMLGVKFPVAFDGAQDQVRGPFLAVLWEDRPEAILSGREELGFAKLYCDLPTPRVHEHVHSCSAAWDGHAFIRLSVSDPQDAVPPQQPFAADGMLHHRYHPRIGQPGVADIEEMVMSPASARLRTLSYHRGTPKIEFVRSTWEELPTMYHIVNALADLPVVEMRAGWIAETRGASDLADQRVLS